MILRAIGLQKSLPLAAALFLALAAPARGDASLEYPVKATYLYKFAPFVEWPADAFGSPQAPFVICVVGTNPFGDYLARSTAGQAVNGHPIQVRYPAGTEGCHIAFLAADAPVPDDAAAVLTVTDNAAGGTHGVVNFVVEANHVRFDIDAGAAAHRRLVISSKLLSLAKSVRGQP